MKIVSVNVGLPREVEWRGQTVSTGIFKEPVAGRVAVRTLNLDGDRQADLSVHGGVHKAAYCYPVDHYDYWKKQMPDREFPVAIFGENFTAEGVSESTVHLGDRFRVGTAEVIVSQPRMPCFKLGIRFHMDEMVKIFLASGRTGFYFAVTGEGDVAAGDEIELLSRDPNAVSIAEIVRLYVTKEYKAAEQDTIRRALQVPSFPDSWKDYFVERLAGN